MSNASIQLPGSFGYRVESLLPGTILSGLISLYIFLCLNLILLDPISICELSHINEIIKIFLVYNPMSYSTHCQLVLGWNLLRLMNWTLVRTYRRAQAQRKKLSQNLKSYYGHRITSGGLKQNEKIKVKGVASVGTTLD